MEDLRNMSALYRQSDANSLVLKADCSPPAIFGDFHG